MFRERNIQNPSIFRTTSISRTLTYLDLGAYLQQCQTSTMKSFVKHSYLVDILMFREMKLSLAPGLKLFLYFRAEYLSQPFLRSLEKKNSLSKEIFLIL